MSVLLQPTQAVPASRSRRPAVSSSFSSPAPRQPGRLLVWVFGQLDKRAPFEDYALRLAERGHEAGLVVDIVAGPVADPALRADLEAAGATLTCLPHGALESGWQFAKEMLRRRPTLVHCHFGSPSTVLAPIARILGARGFVFTDHGSRRTVEPVGGLKLTLRRLRRRMQAAFIDRWLPVSSFNGDMVMREVGVARDRVRTLFNGIDLSRARHAEARGRAATRARLGLPADARIALFVGDLSEAKGVDDILAIQNLMLAAEPASIMVWVGDGALRDEVQRTAGPRVLVLGRRGDVPDLLCASDVLLVPSRWFEAFSLVAAEAAAAGVPVVASRIGGIPEVVLDGETGLLITPGDRKALLAAVALLLGDAELCDRLGSAARRRAEAAFCLDRMVTATLDEYRTLLAKVSPGFQSSQVTRSA
nr:glycosyltransferase family 4 protein [uncultured Rhodopila sp.]